MTAEFENEKGEEGHPFDRIMRVVGENGRYQFRSRILFNFCLVFLASMPCLNFIIALAIPDHWCAVPGRDSTNLSLAEWKSYTIPKEIDTRGLLSYKKCKMFNISTEELETLSFLNVSHHGEIDCQYGWQYDDRWYGSTAATDQDWVCEKDQNVATTFVFSRIGEGIGTIIFGQLGDIIGRKPIYYMAIAFTVVGRCMSALTASNFSWFLFASVIGSLPATSIFQSPLVIVMEMSRPEDRAFLAMLQNISWTISIATMPFIMWFVRDWVIFMLVSTIPCGIFLLLGGFLVESPRWLAGCGKTGRALQELRKIAKINGTYVPDEAALLLRKPPGTKEKMYGVLALFSSWRLAKNTVLLVAGWVITALIYLTLTLNVNNLGGNPYMNYFLQGLAEFPAYLLGKYSSDSLGRRWTHITAFLVTSVACIPIVYTVLTPGYEIMTAALAVFIKFSISFAWFAVNLQALETYPTCVRQTGTSLGAILANVFGVLSPYIVYWGMVNPSVPYIAAGFLCIGGAVCGVFLPETLNQELPETLADAQQFGADQPFWNFPWQYKRAEN